jgi:hypothetical protein
VLGWRDSGHSVRALILPPSQTTPQVYVPPAHPAELLRSLRSSIAALAILPAYLLSSAASSAQFLELVDAGFDCSGSEDAGAARAPHIAPAVAFGAWRLLCQLPTPSGLAAALEALPPASHPQLLPAASPSRTLYAALALQRHAQGVRFETLLDAPTASLRARR